MFESVCIRPTGDGVGSGALDLGVVAEALLFYGRIDLVANRNIVTTLLNELGADALVRLVESDRITLSYCNQFTSVLTEDAGTAHERYFLGTSEMPHTRIEQLATEIFREATGKSGRGRRMASRFLAHVGHISLDEDLHTSATADALDTEYATGLIRDVLSSMAPGYQPPDPLAFDVERVEDGRLRLTTNLDWALLTRHWRPARETPVTAADLLLWVLSIHEELAFAGHFADEMISNPHTAALLKRKTEALLARSRSAGVQGSFQDLVFADARCVREAVNAGDRSLVDALELAERGARFRSWLQGIPTDDNLVREYLAACTAETWADALPTKTARWVLVTGASTAAGAAIAGPLGIAAGTVIGAADFLQDVLRRGWRPSQFVQGPLRTFVQRDSP